MLKELINKLVEKSSKKETKPVSSNDISRRRDLIPMPVREEFLSDPLKLEKIDELKKEYLKTLRLTRTITSVDIMPEELHDYQNIYYDLLMNIFAKESEVSFEKVDEVKDEKLELSIECYKLRLYLERVRELIIEARLRLIALNELLKERILSRNKKSAIVNEIDNLSHLYLNFSTKELAMIKGIHSYLTNIRTLDIKTFLEKLYNPNVEEKDDKEAITKRLEEVREMAMLVIPNIVGYLESLNLSPKSLIAYLEQELEIYVYTHQDDLAKLREETDKIAYSLKATFIQELKGRKEEYLDRIKGLELRYKVFSVYGRNLVTYEDLEKLYESKFKVLTIDILDDSYSNMIIDITTTEFKVYQDIILSLINQILDGKNSYINTLTRSPHINAPKMVKLIMKVLTGDKEKFDVREILKDRLKLGFLIALNKKDLEKFFDNIKVKKANYPKLNFYDALFRWKEYLPLRTIFELKKCNMEMDSFLDFDKDPLYQIYILVSKTFTEEKWLEGLVEIKPYYVINENRETLLKVKEYFRNKFKVELILPSTLKILNGFFFHNSSIKCLFLNGGIEKVGDLSMPDLEYLYVPPSVKKLRDVKAKTIVFQDYEESLLLKSVDALGEFLYYSLSFWGGFVSNSSASEMKFEEIKLLSPTSEVIIKNSDIFVHKPDNWDNLHFSEQKVILCEIFKGLIQEQLRVNSNDGVKRT